MSQAEALFGRSKPIIAMIHVGALPGTPAGALGLAEIEKQALREAKILRGAGVHGLMLENMHDTPYLRGAVGPEIVAAMAILARAVKEASKLPCGIQILAGSNREAMAFAHSSGLDLIRFDGFRFRPVADEVILQSASAHPLQYRLW